MASAACISQIELHVLAANYAVSKWFQGCVNADKISGYVFTAHQEMPSEISVQHKAISIPLVWRYERFTEGDYPVRVQFKASLGDVDTFEKSEWGPWVKTKVSRNNPLRGEVEEVWVKRSDPKGVDLMHHYPDVKDDPGLEEWLPADKWSMDKVFSDINRWVYDDGSKVTQRKAEWNALRAWHRAYATSNSVQAGQRYTVGQDFVIGSSPILSWSEMWKLLDSRAPWNQPDGAAAANASCSACISQLNSEAAVD
eukprot:2647510-Pleurochrysis_carterae.AAC.1